MHMHAQPVEYPYKYRVPRLIGPSLLWLDKFSVFPCLNSNLKKKEIKLMYLVRLSWTTGTNKISACSSYQLVQN